ncbi:variant-type mycofactocin precursor [Desulfosarcina variabilis]|jgi:mycofactocin precursor
MEKNRQNEAVEAKVDGPEENDPKEDIFSVEEIKIEEMAIDGICGVY